VFRRQFKQLEGPEGIIERSKRSVGRSDRYNNSRMIWRLGARMLEFGAVDHEDDKEKYQGRAHDFKGFDEITQFTETQYLYLTAWARTTVPGQRVRTIACGNPPQNAEGEWVLQRWAPWLDEQHPRPAHPGELRWFARIDGKDAEVEGPAPFVHHGEAIKPSSRTFIPARVEDNPYLLATDYVRRLQTMPEPLRSQLLFGDHAIGLADDEWQVIR
jgi:Terminase large subunit, T4likevirus-type, N-terminal